MAIRPDSPLGRAVLASRFKPPLVRITLPPRLANFLIAAGAQSSSSDDRMSVEFKPRQGEPDPSPGQDPDRGSVADPSSEDSGARPGDPSRAEEDRWQAIAAGLLDVITDAKLTPQEGKLATLLTRGYGVSAISRELGLTDILTDSLLIGLLRKLDLSSRSAGLSAYALSYWESRQNSAVVAAWWEQVLSFRATDRAKLAELLARPDLTPQEREIVTLLAKGRGFQAIARELGISLRAAKTHGREIYAKLSPDRYRRVQAGEARRRPRDPLVEEYPWIGRLVALAHGFEPEMTPAEPHMTTAEVQPGMTDEAQPEMTDDVDPTMTHDAEPAITPRRDDEPSWRARQRYADPPEVLERPESSTLTSREREVAALIASGYDTRAIAHELAISEATVRTLTRRVLSKLGVTASRLAGKESGGPRDDTEAG